MKVSGQFHAAADLFLEIVGGSRLVGGWLDLRVGLDILTKRKIRPVPGIEPRLSSFGPLLYRVVFVVIIIIVVNIIIVMCMKIKSKQRM
jgi:hypothetical protein